MTIKKSKFVQSLSAFREFPGQGHRNIRVHVDKEDLYPVPDQVPDGRLAFPAEHVTLCQDLYPASVFFLQRPLGLDKVGCIGCALILGIDKTHLQGFCAFRAAQETGHDRCRDQHDRAYNGRQDDLFFHALSPFSGSLRSETLPEL